MYSTSTFFFLNENTMFVMFFKVFRIFCEVCSYEVQSGNDIDSG